MTKRLLKFSKTFRDDQSGATSIEYGLLALLMSVGLIAALYSIRASLVDFFTSAASALVV